MSTDQETRIGRPRDAAIDDAVLGTTLAVLHDGGYTHLRVEEVARRAGTSKPAIYRRWPTRQHLVLATLARSLGTIDPPDTGCTMCDLAECLELFVRAFECMPPDVLAPLLADCAGDDALRARFMTALFDPPREAVRTTLSSALARGDLRAGLDLDLAVDLLGAFVYYRVLFGHAATSPRDINLTVETVLSGLAADYEELLRQAQGHDLNGEPHQIHHS